ncbi:MAG: tetratricopeptide repeat protein, partial [Planctomycetota bacterium]|nr:tetratricopeptide repeat protein [Planctomycetota bacterium]
MKLTQFESESKLAEAERLSSEIVLTSKEFFGGTDHRTGSAWDRHGNHLFQLSRFADAEREFRTALEIRLRELGDSHPLTADTINNLASTLNALGRYSEAAQTHERALRIRIATLGEENPETATSYNN